MLEGFLYYDPFLRYLHTTGPIHASKLKNLEFEGVIRLYQCEEGDCAVDVCLMQALYVYVNFIAQFCTAVEKVEYISFLGALGFKLTVKTCTKMWAFLTANSSCEPSRIMNLVSLDPCAQCLRKQVYSEESPSSYCNQVGAHKKYDEAKDIRCFHVTSS